MRITSRPQYSKWAASRLGAHRMHVSNARAYRHMQLSIDLWSLGRDLPVTVNDEYFEAPIATTNSKAERYRQAS